MITPTLLLLPDRQHYQIEEVFHLIAANKFPCDHKLPCGSCPIYQAFSKSWKAPIPSCDSVMANRSAEMHYLSRQVALAAKNNVLRLWDPRWQHALPLPTHDTEKTATPDQLKYWVKAGSVYQDDLTRFLKDERIPFAFESEDKPGTELAIAHEENIKQQEPVKPKREKKDELPILIDQILGENPSLTPTEVMLRLLAQCGAKESIITENMGDGFRWEPFNRTPQHCTIKNLEDRIYRWKSKRKNIDKTPRKTRV